MDTTAVWKIHYSRPRALCARNSLGCRFLKSGELLKAAVSGCTSPEPRPGLPSHNVLTRRWVCASHILPAALRRNCCSARTRSLFLLSYYFSHQPMHFQPITAQVLQRVPESPAPRTPPTLAAVLCRGHRCRQHDSRSLQSPARRL